MEKIQDVTRSFDGSGNVENWIKKIRLVAKLKEVKKLESFLPLFLEGDAFAVYDELSEESKGSIQKIEQALLSAFAQNRYSAYDTFRQRNWCPGEAVDVYMSDVRRLARLAKIENDDVIRCAFIRGLPSDISAQLRISTTINTMDMAVVVEQARVLMSDRLHGAMAAHAKYASTRSGTGIPTPRSQHADGNHRMSDDQNLSSDREHQGRHFPSRRYQQQHRRSIVCYACGREGHIARSCHLNLQGASSTPMVPQGASQVYQQ